MDSVLPNLLAALSRQSQPDAAFARLDAMFARLPAGVQLLSLFQRNPGLLDRVAAVLGAAPSLSDHLARTPSALEGLLSPAAAPGSGGCCGPGLGSCAISRRRLRLFARRCARSSSPYRSRPWRGGWMPMRRG